ncbi:MAG: glutathione S-transferase family protein [Alphaproteobacteria bacterium]|nr:glutathione S-transferase family protein [Alphaproteobacteria bacterium]
MAKATKKAARKAPAAKKAPAGKASARKAAAKPAARKRKVLAATPAIAKAAAKSARRAARGARILKGPAVAAAPAARRPARPVLHGLWLSIPACKVGLALSMMGVDFDYRHVDLSSGAQKSAEFLARNRFGQVPVLEHEGHHVAQSNVILHYLADAYDQFLGRSAAEEIRVEEWLQWDQDRMSSLAMLRSMKRFPRYKQPDEVVAFVSGRAVQALDFLDHHLGTSKFVAGPRPTVADIAIFATVALADEAEVEIARWPNVRAWAERFLKLPGAMHPYAAMPREDRIGG